MRPETEALLFQEAVDLVHPRRVRRSTGHGGLGRGMWAEERRAPSFRRVLDSQHHHQPQPQPQPQPQQLPPGPSSSPPLLLSFSPPS
jgi:hypothetical protein